MHARAYFSGFGDCATNHKIYLESQRLAKLHGAPPKSEPIPPFNGIKNSQFIPIVRPLSQPNTEVTL